MLEPGTKAPDFALRDQKMCIRDSTWTGIIAILKLPLWEWRFMDLSGSL